MVIMEEGATPEQIAAVVVELRKYGLDAMLVKVPCQGFNKNKFEEER